MTLIAPHQSPDAIAERAVAHLETVVRVESSSDERSETIPSTQGQIDLADLLAGFFADLGATIERDAHANVIASLPGRGLRAEAPPLALLIHVDTARGTQPVDALTLHPAWDGAPLTYSANAALRVGVEHYPALSAFVGQDILHGPGDAPFGLDDKLGLSHLMTLAWLLHTNPDIPHPPLLLIGRPDEEIGRMEALLGLADLMERRGVRSGFTVDGIEPYEINVENFNASQGSVWFTPEAHPPVEGARALPLFIGGVNTHGATAKAEGHRPATRLAAEIFARLTDEGLTPGRLRPLTFASDALRDCDADITALAADPEAAERLRAAVEEIVSPHVPRGASCRVGTFEDAPEVDPAHDKGAALAALRFVTRFLSSDPGFPLSAEDSAAFEGYSQPYRLVADPLENAPDALRLDVRIRDFSPEGLAARERHLRDLVAEAHPTRFRAQYVNMGPRLADRPELIQWARDAAEPLDVDARVLPIRGGTGVDPFLDKGIAIANLGTGYFAPESEKELTSLQTMAGHARWLLNLVQIAAAAR